MISGGSICATTTSALPGYDVSGAITVAAGGTLGVYPANWSPDNIATLQASASFASGAMLGLVVDDGNAFDYTSPIAGSMEIAKLGGGSLTLGAAETDAAGTAVLGGTLLLGAGGSLAATGPITVGAGATLDLGGSTVTTSGLISVEGGTVQNGTLVESGTQGFDAQSGTVTADLAGNVGLTKTTAGTLLLTGSDSYTGQTTAAAGVLEAASTAALPGYGTAGQLSIASGATVMVLAGERTTGPAAKSPASWRTCRRPRAISASTWPTARASTTRPPSAATGKSTSSAAAS